MLPGEDDVNAGVGTLDAGADTGGKPPQGDGAPAPDAGQAKPPSEGGEKTPSEGETSGAAGQPPVKLPNAGRRSIWRS